MINMRPGTYRLRFSREGSITLEREVTLRAGEAATVDVALSPAPPPEKAPGASRAAAGVGPARTSRRSEGDARSAVPRKEFHRRARRAKGLRPRLHRRPERRHCTSFEIRGRRMRTTRQQNGFTLSPVRASCASAQPIKSCRPAPSASSRTRSRMRWCRRGATR